MTWFPVCAALLMLPACSTPPPRAASPAGRPLPAATLLPAQPTAAPTERSLPAQTPMPDATPQPPQIDSNLAVPIETPASSGNEAPANSPPARAAIAALAKQLTIDPQNIRVLSVEEVEWPDGCLGISQPDRMCTQAIVPGYRVMLEVNGKQYEARTTLNARQAAIVPQP